MGKKRTKEEVIEKLEVIHKIIDELSGEMKEELGGDLKDNFAIVGPKLGDAKTMLRIYAYGGDIGKLATSTGESKVLREGYRKEGVYLTEEESQELESIISSEDKDKVLTNKKYLKLACRAARNKFTKGKGKEDKERRIQTQIVKKYMKVEDSFKWCIVDMEFYLGIDWGKPDIVVFDRKRRQLGLIELKYMNRSYSNIFDHYKDFRKTYDAPYSFNSEVMRRIRYLSDYGLISDIAKDEIYKVLGTEEKKKQIGIWFGFLFVGGKESTSKKIVNNHIRKKLEFNSEFEENSAIEDCRFLYVSDIEELKQTGLCYSQMKTIEEFLKG